jgi:hypothetical protein
MRSKDGGVPAGPWRSGHRPPGQLRPLSGAVVVHEHPPPGGLANDVDAALAEPAPQESRQQVPGLQRGRTACASRPEK